VQCVTLGDDLLAEIDLRQEIRIAPSRAASLHGMSGANDHRDASGRWIPPDKRAKPAMSQPVPTPREQTPPPPLPPPPSQHRDDQLARIEQWLAAMHHQQKVRDTQLQINHQERQSSSSGSAGAQVWISVMLTLLLIVTTVGWLSSCVPSCLPKSSSVYVP